MTPPASRPPADDPARPEPVVRTAAGSVRGRYAGEPAVFRGIPFAEPPVGEVVRSVFPDRPNCDDGWWHPPAHGMGRVGSLQNPLPKCLSTARPAVPKLG